MTDPYPPPYRSEDRKRHEWQCPLPACGQLIQMIGPNSLKIAVELHQFEHEKRARQYGATNYDRLHLTFDDRAMLQGMLIKVED
jgi:hypothetical protein